MFAIARTVVAICALMLPNTGHTSRSLFAIDEDLINELLSAVGEVCKDVTVADVCIESPKILLSDGGSSFSAVAKIKNSFFGVSRRPVAGKIGFAVDIRNSKLLVNITGVKALNAPIIGDLNVSNWYDPSFDVNLQIPKTLNINGRPVDLLLQGAEVAIDRKFVTVYSELRFIGKLK